MSDLTPTFTDLLHKQDKSLSLHSRPLTTKTADEFLKEAYRIVRQHLPPTMPILTMALEYTHFLTSRSPAQNPPILPQHLNALRNQ